MEFWLKLLVELVGLLLTWQPELVLLLLLVRLGWVLLIVLDWRLLLCRLRLRHRLLH